MLQSATLRKFARSHLRLWSSIGVALIVALCLPTSWSVAARVLLAWNCGVVLFLVLIWRWMTRLPSDSMRSHFEDEDETAAVILLIVTLSALLSLVAIVALLAGFKQLENSARVAHLSLAAMTIVSSWTLVPTMFTLHYASRYYGSKADSRPLAFPQTKLPEFWDFAYFSFTIAVACQTADVSTNTATMRRLVLGHAIVSFIFNASILGFAINVSAGLVGGS